MYKKYLVINTWLLFTINFSLYSQYSFTITGKLPSLKNKFLFLEYDLNRVIKKDSIKIDKTGVFEYKSNDSVEYISIKYQDDLNELHSMNEAGIILYDKIRLEISEKDGEYFLQDAFKVNECNENIRSLISGFDNIDSDLPLEKFDSLMNKILYQCIKKYHTYKFPERLQYVSNDFNAWIYYNYYFDKWIYYRYDLKYTNDFDSVVNGLKRGFNSFYDTLSLEILRANPILLQLSVNINHIDYCRNNNCNRILYNSFLDFNDPYIRDYLIFIKILNSSVNLDLTNKDFFPVIDSVMNAWKTKGNVDTTYYNECFKIVKRLNVWRKDSVIPDFEFTDTAGKKYKLSDFKDKYIYLHFWGTHCGPCIKDFPNVNNLYDQTGDKNVVILNICSGNDEEMKKVLEKHELKGVSFSAEGNLPYDYGVFFSRIPYYMLVAPGNRMLEIQTYKPTEFIKKLGELPLSKSQ